MILTGKLGASGKEDDSSSSQCGPFHHILVEQEIDLERYNWQDFPYQAHDSIDQEELGQ